MESTFGLILQRRRATSPIAVPLATLQLARTSPILEFLFFHKAIRAELQRLHHDAIAVERGSEIELQALSKRFQFLHVVYVEHSNAEDEIIFPALDSRVKNVARTYSLEHEEESGLFDQMLEVLNCALKNKENISAKLRRELVCCTEAIQTTLCQHMSKEEEQIFPLLLEHFNFEEQATLVWQFLCSIPVKLMEEFLPWLASSLSEDEQQEMIACLLKIVPKEELLRQVIFTWLKRGSISSQLESERAICKDVSSSANEASRVSKAEPVEDPSTSETIRASLLRLEDVGSSTENKGSYDGATVVADTRKVVPINFPINEVLYWHNAIRKELVEFADEAKKIQLSACVLPSNLSSFSDRLQFLAEVCIFHSAAEDKVLFPAVGRKAKYGVSFVSDHKQEERQFDDVRRLLDSMHAVGEGSLTEAEICEKLRSQADLIVETVQQHLLDEEIRVLPLAREHCSVEEQRDLLYQSLRVMPLKLLERVLPWLVAVLSEEEAKSMLHNMHLAAPVGDAALVTLFSGWACKGQTQNNGDSENFKCISNSLDGCLIKALNSKKTKSCCYCEATNPDRPSEQEVECRVTNFDKRALKRLRPCDEVLEEELIIADDIDSTSLDQPCCVPGLGVSSSSLGFGAGSTIRSLRSPITNGYLGSGLFGWGNNSCLAGSGTVPKPIDTIFQFHKAIRKDLEYLDSESSKLADCDDEFLRQFTGRFRLLWGLYRAHSNAEDEIVFPALEAKEALHNVSHSYTIDHKQEEQLLNGISNVLSSLSQLQGGMQGQAAVKGQDVEINDAIRNKHSDDLSHKEELAAKLQGMCKSVHISLDQHVSREELELWPLFDLHFTVDEQDKLIGQIIGTTGAGVLQTMLPWVTTALTQEEQCTMMDTWRQATRNTMFDEWLRAWWKGSPAASPRPQQLEQQDVPESGTPECLQIVADYLSQGVSNIDNPEKEKENLSVSIDTDNIDGRGIACEAPAAQGSNNKEIEEHKMHRSKATACEQVYTDSEKQKVLTGEGNLVENQLEDGTRKFKPGWQDIFRMNQKELEAAMRKVSNDKSLDPRRKAYLMQNLLTSRWIVAQQQQPYSFIGQVGNDQEDIPGRFPLYHDVEKKIYGCEHYKRNCKVRAACCGLLFTCRFCHDKVSDHSMDRQATKEMMCMQCLEVQPVAQYCATPSCNGFCMARYYCNICKLFDDDNRDIYHCPFCNLCRVGKGLGVDYFHCMTCNACMAMSLTVHKCREKGLESNCPICHDYLFTSKAPVKALACGHFMHSACFQAYTCSHYTCPICSKSLGDMAAYFGMLDALLAAEELPEEYRDKLQDILCNDCEHKGTAPFHWLYFKCSKCGSYNTRAI